MNHTLLPEKEIAHLNHEYRLRFFILFIFFLSGAVWIGIISLFPSYIISVTGERNALQESGKINASDEAKNETQTLAEVSDANGVIQTLASAQDTIFFSTLIEDIDSHRVPGITLAGFELAHMVDATSSAQASIVINGNAATRDDLIAFEKNLEGDPRLADVELPVSDLALDSNINFTMSMQSVD